MSDKREACPKCGCEWLNPRRYNAERDIIERSCPCGYKWNELPKDSGIDQTRIARERTIDGSHK